MGCAFGNDAEGKAFDLVVAAFRRGGGDVAVRDDGVHAVLPRPGRITSFGRLRQGWASRREFLFGGGNARVSLAGWISLLYAVRTEVAGFREEVESAYAAVGRYAGCRSPEELLLKMEVLA